MLVATLLGACGGEAMPRVRVGALPFPGPLTLYTTADPTRLGPHHYEDWSSRPFAPQEGDEGIVYTKRAGFLDLSHLRETADWVRYISGRVAAELMDSTGESRTISWAHQDTRYSLEVCPPEWFAALPRQERAQRVTELAADIASATTYLLMTWHEVATWYGWSTLPLVSEKRSAFTWDDITSHLVGIEIGRRVIISGMSSGKEYDRAIADSIQAELRRLEAVSPQECDAASDRVKGRWWTPTTTGGEPIRRHTSIGLDGRPVSPWLVDRGQPTLFYAPLGLLSRGQDISTCWSLRLSPPEWLRTLATGSSTTMNAETYIEARRSMPQIVEQVADDMRAQFGPDCCTH